MSEVLAVSLPLAPEERVVLTGQRWEDYLSILQDIGDSRIFVTFDGERIEIMAPSWEHDAEGNALGVIISVLAEELEIPFKGGGSFTLKRSDIERGLQSDRCFYFKNAHLIVGKKSVSLDRDPPPDLAIEVEVTARLLDREGIYAALKVPELWRLRDGALRMFALRRGKYQLIERSGIFPQIAPVQIVRLLERSHTTDDLQWIKWMRRWIRQNLSRSRPRR